MVGGPRLRSLVASLLVWGAGFLPLARWGRGECSFRYHKSGAVAVQRSQHGWSAGSSGGSRSRAGARARAASFFSCTSRVLVLVLRARVVLQEFVRVQVRSSV